MKNFLIILSVFALFASCQQSLEDRAAKEMAEYTRKNCPTPVVNNENVDSATFEPSTRTVHYYYKLHGEIDNAAIIAKHRKEMRAALLNDLRSDTKSKRLRMQVSDSTILTALPRTPKKSSRRELHAE